MEEERPERTCGQACSQEMSDLFCKPKARCFKGLAILTGVYTLACGVMLMIIPPVVNSHGYKAEGKVADNLHKMVLSSIILMILFAGLSVISLLCCQIFTKREGRRESVLNGQLMDNADFHQLGNDNNNDFEER